METLVPIPGFTAYGITKTGIVYNLHRRRRLLDRKSQFGYRMINLRASGKRYTVFVHRLVALAYLPNPTNAPFVNHKDFNRENNHVNNLEWVTAKQNINYSLENGRLPRGETSYLSKLTDEKVKQIRELRKTQNVSLTQLAKQFEVCFQCIHHVVTNKTWRHLVS